MGSSPPAKKRRVADLLCGDTDAPVIDEGAASLRADGSWAAAEAITRQMPSGSVPLTILTGFLGAGKSTVLNYILRADHGLRIAVLINEFGAVDIDNQLVDTRAEGAEGDPIQLNNGCVCCTISNGFIDAVQRILDRPGDRPHYFILETSGVADPKPIIDSVSNTELRNDMYVDQVLTVIDSSSWTAEHYDSETAIKQLQFADTVLLSKTDLVKDDQIKQVIDTLEEIKPHVRILKSQKGYVPLAALFDLNIAKRSLEEEEKAKKQAEGSPKKSPTEPESEGCTNDVKKPADGDAKEHGKHDCGHKHAPGEKCGHDHHDQKGNDHTHEKKKPNHLEQEGFSSISFTSNKSFSLSRFRQDFMEELPTGVFRAKGLLWFRNYPSRFVFHWSGSRFNVEEDDWPEGVEPSNQLVVIGRKLDHDVITTMLEHCLSRDTDPDEEDDMDEEDDDEEDIYGEDGMDGVEPGAEAINGAPLAAMTGAPSNMLQAPILGIGPELMPSNMQLPALNTLGAPTLAPVQLPGINLMQGGPGEGNTLPSIIDGKLPALAPLAPPMGAGIPANAVAEPAVEAPLLNAEGSDGAQ